MGGFWKLWFDPQKEQQIKLGGLKQRKNAGIRLGCPRIKRMIHRKRVHGVLYIMPMLLPTAILYTELSSADRFQSF